MSDYTDTMVERPYRGEGYYPGEPYEFYGRYLPGFPLRLRYRCFRGNCKGVAVMVSDRNTHNSYHNDNES